MDVGGLALACFEVFSTLIELSITLSSSIRTAKNFGKDAERLAARIGDEIERVRQLRSLLLEKGKIFSDASLFEQLSLQSQDNLASLLYIVTGPLLGESGALWSAYLARSQALNEYDAAQTSAAHRDLDEMVRALSLKPASVDYQNNAALQAKIKWVLMDKKRAEHIVDDISDVTRRVKDDIELFCFPLGILSHKAASLKADIDATRIGWSTSIELSRLIREGANTAQGLEVNQNEVVEDEEELRPGLNYMRGYFRSVPTVIDFKYYRHDGSHDANDEATGSIHSLASLLKQSSAADSGKFRIPAFSGFFQDLRKHRFAFLFSYPTGASDNPPASLSEILDSRVYSCPLEMRFKIAHVLAGAISELHRVQWIHKNLHSANILFFEMMSSDPNPCIRNKAAKASMNGPWLLGFAYARQEDGRTSLSVETRFDVCIYRHPQRWAEPLRSRRIHDIYSLGVILLEIGLWKPIVNTIPDDLRRAGSNMQRGIANARLKNKILDHYRALCTDELSGTMGSRYSDVVLRCLNGDFDLPAQDQGDEELQKRFWKDVVDVLREMLDRIS